MSTTKNKLTPQELVRQKFPDAFVDDDGEWVYIKNKKTITERCPHCHQNWTHQVVDLMGGNLGSGGSGESAWKNAAESFGLI